MDPQAHALTIKDFCAAFAIGRSLAYREIAAGRLNAKKVGKRTLILKADADAWASALPAVASRD